MDIFQVDERGFYMRLVCNKGDGVAASLYKVLESLTSFNVQSSNVSSATDRLELTVTLQVYIYIYIYRYDQYINIYLPWFSKNFLSVIINIYI